MKYLLCMMLLTISNSFATAQFSEHRIYEKIDVYYHGIYHYSRQRREEFRHITYKYLVSTNHTYYLEYDQYEHIIFLEV
jgi:pantothenate kinase